LQECPDACLCFRIVLRQVHQHPNAPHAVRLGARRERPHCRASEQRDELAASQFIELHSIPSARAALQDIKWAGISQRICASRARPFQEGSLSTLAQWFIKGLSA
jgi:hypothetical protein